MKKTILELDWQSLLKLLGKSLSIAKQSEMIAKIQDILDNETDFNKLKVILKKPLKSML
jgi:hypothetical protein